MGDIMYVKKFMRALKTLIKAVVGLEPIVWPDLRPVTQRFGSEYGGWDIITGRMSRNAVVYSFGIGEDISFDTEVIAHFSAIVHAFDPTPKSLAWLSGRPLPTELIVHDYGLAGFDGMATFYPPENNAHVSHTMLARAASAERAIRVPVRRLRTIMQELGHTSIDLLKMDIEGAEYDVIADIVASDIRPQQLLVEFHHRFPGATVERTRKAISSLRSVGYKLFFVSETNEEYGFVYAGRGEPVAKTSVLQAGNGRSNP